MAANVAVLIEQGTTKCFASALDWPGWARPGRDPDAAIAALEAYRSRYAGVLAASALDAPSGPLVVVACVLGDATTDFGAPSQICELDHRVLRPASRASIAATMAACWERFDAVAARGGPLRTGPRGGGRDVVQMIAHVEAAEVAYARRLGLHVASTKDDRTAVVALRARVLEVIEKTEVADRHARWPLRYAARRIAWHVSDHLFEIEDRSMT